MAHWLAFTSRGRPGTLARRLPALAALALLPLAAAAQSVKLSAPLVHPGADVLEFAVDPTGTLAFYVADQDQLGIKELFVVPLDQSSPPLRLSAPLPAHGDVAGNAGLPSFLVGPAGQVVYRADPGADEAFGIFGAPSDGSQPAVQLTPTMTWGGQVWSFALSPDGMQVVYVADQDTDDVYELFVAPTDGSATARKLHAPFVDEDTYGFFVDATGTRVLYPTVRYSTGGELLNDLYSVALDSVAAPVLLASYTFSAFSQGVDQVDFSPDGAWAAFTTRFEQSFEGYSSLDLVPVDGGTAARALAPPGGLFASAGKFTSDGSRVIFSTATASSGSEPSHNLYAATLVDDAVPLDEAEMGNVNVWRLDPTGSTVFFAQPSGIYRVPADGSAAQVQLAAGPAAPGTYESFEVAPDGSRAVFVFRDSVTALEQLASVPSLGGPAVSLAPSVAGRLFWNFRFTAGGASVVYDVRVSPSVHELFVVPSDGSRGPRRVNGGLPSGGTVLWNSNRAKPHFTVRDGWAVYLASEDASGVFELFKAPLDARRVRRAEGAPLALPR